MILTVFFSWLPNANSAELMPQGESSAVQRSVQPEIIPQNENSNPTTVEENKQEIVLSAENTDTTEVTVGNATPLQKIKEYFSADLRILAYGIILDPKDSIRNPNNDLLEIPHYIFDLEIRPDFYFDSDYLQLSAKPREKVDYRIWQEGNREGDTDYKDDWYMNEWLVRVKAWDRLFVSYGRENLQWGPSFLFSPSNPFFSDNGRSNTYMEVPGMDFGRLIFIPHMCWSISLIVNTDEGRNPPLGPDPSDDIYAAKIDYTGKNGYGSLIFSRKEFNQTNTFGFYGGWTASDALLLYTEGSMQKGSDAYYPVRDTSFFGASLQKIYEDENDIKPTILAGGAYTFSNSGTFTLEYLYNGRGYDRDEANLYFSTIQKAADMYYNFLLSADSESEKQQIAGSFKQYASAQNVDSGLRFLRKNYAMLQYYQTNIHDRLAVTLRWTQNIDDGSGQFFGLFSYSVGDHWDIFGSGMFNVGSDDTEYGSFLHYQGMLGIKFSL